MPSVTAKTAATAAPDVKPAGDDAEVKRLRALRLVLLGAVLLGGLASLNLWLNARPFPRLPIVDGFPALPGPFDAILLGVLALALVGAMRFFRPAIIFFLVATLFLYLGDQQRGQPWFYLYWVLLLAALLPAGPALAAARLIVAGAYVWAGVQKCGPDFYRLVVPYLLQPVALWLQPAGVNMAAWLIKATPALEIFIGLALWVPRLRTAAIFTNVGVHAAALLLLGPLGHRHNLVVWPWNAAMIALVVVLFWRSDLRGTWGEWRRSRIAVAVTLLVLLLPVLSYRGWWDSYFSFALYSGNTATADFIITPGLAARLPERMRPFAHPLHADVTLANPSLAGLLVFDVQSWTQAEMGVPPIPEPRSFRCIGRHLAPFAREPLDLQLVLQPRGGGVQVLRAAELK